MRVWGHADPRMLNRKHLLGEHREIHALLNFEFNWGTNPEFVRFMDLGHDRARALLTLRHELLRIAMNVRYKGRHTVAEHGTQMLDADMALLTPRMMGILKVYSKDAYLTERHLYDVETCQLRFIRMMHMIEYPPCRLPGGDETPWDRDGLTLDEYLLLGDAWNKTDHHKGISYRDAQKEAA